MKNFMLPLSISSIINCTFKATVLTIPIAIVSMMSAYAVDLTESAVQNFASELKQAANQKNLNDVAKLVADDASISLSRNGKTTFLDKSAYLDLLQSSWTQNRNYHYDNSIDNIVIIGDRAKADFRTVESWTSDGKNTKLTTNAQATLTAGSDNVVLLRAVAQATIE